MASAKLSLRGVTKEMNYLLPYFPEENETRKYPCCLKPNIWSQEKKKLKAHATIKYDALVAVFSKTWVGLFKIMGWERQEGKWHVSSKCIMWCWFEYYLNPAWISEFLNKIRNFELISFQDAW